MLELLSGFPANVVAVSASGCVTSEDYDEVLIPALKAAFEGRDRIRVYYELGRQFEGMRPGAMVEDFKVGVEHLTGWERIAVVTDVSWIRTAMVAFGFLLPGAVKVFHSNEGAEARAWIASA